MDRARGTQFPNASGYTFGCPSGGSLPAGVSPDETGRPWLVVEIMPSVSDVVVDSVVITYEHALVSQRETRTGYGRISSYLYMSFGGTLLSFPGSHPLADAAHTVAAVVYHRRGSSAFTSPRVSYRCEP